MNDYFIFLTSHGGGGTNLDAPKISDFTNVLKKSFEFFKIEFDIYGGTFSWLKIMIALVVLSVIARAIGTLIGIAVWGDSPGEAMKKSKQKEFDDMAMRDKINSKGYSRVDWHE